MTSHPYPHKGTGMCAISQDSHSKALCNLDSAREVSLFVLSKKTWSLILSVSNYGTHLGVWFVITGYWPKLPPGALAPSCWRYEIVALLSAHLSGLLNRWWGDEGLLQPRNHSSWTRGHAGPLWEQAPHGFYSSPGTQAIIVPAHGMVAEAWVASSVHMALQNTWQEAALSKRIHGHCHCWFLSLAKCSTIKPCNQLPLSREKNCKWSPRNCA